MKSRLRVWAALVLSLVVLASVPVAGREVPFLSGRIVDEADLLPPADEERLSGELAALEEETGAQVAVLTIPSLEDEVLEDYALRVAETWKLGRGEFDDGLLFLIARDDRKMRLEVGYGLEPTIPDVTAKRILDEIVTPRFRQGDFVAGIEAGLDAVATKIRGGELPAPEPSTPSAGLPLVPRLFAGGLFTAVIGVFATIALFSNGCQSWFLYVFLVPFFATFPAVLFHPFAGMFALLAWIIGFPLFKLWYAKTDMGKRFRQAHPTLVDWSAARAGGFGSGGGGGFSGGGGSFGGGGASGGW